jgi:flagellar hook-associated protein 1 FlgK
VSGRDFFVGTDAHNVALADCVVDSLTVIAAGLTGEPGDGRNAAAIGELRHLMVLGPDACYRDTVSALGARVRLAEDERETEEVLYGQVEQLREQVAGVSLDEEMADLMRYQLAYNAAARLLTVLDEMLERLILNTGIVGR